LVQLLRQYTPKQAPVRDGNGSHTLKHPTLAWNSPATKLRAWGGTQ
jgi:hypothetical protein